MVNPSDPAFEEHLAALRRALKRARDERGACPPWDELRADLLPGGKNRPGRGERLTHSELCPYCSEQVQTWKKSFDHTADMLGAVEKGIVSGLAGGARGLVHRLAQAKQRAETKAATAASSSPATGAAPQDSAPGAGTPPPTPTYLAPTYVPPTPRAAASPPAPGARTDAGATRAPSPARILVVEMADRRPPPESIFLCAAVLEAEVAALEDVRELANDPDLALVCGIVLGGMRPPAEWPTAVREARKLVPGRPVVLLAAFGATPSAGARRALGDCLIGEDEPAERLLLALDRSLR